MVDATDYFLNSMVVLTTLVVMFLIYDSTDDMLSPMMALQQEAKISVEILSEKCSNVWKTTHEGGDPVQYDLSRKPKYSDPRGFCGRLPANVSAPHLWNEHLDWILQASSNEQDISSHLVTSKLLHFLTPSKYLELGHRSRPSRQAWGRILKKIDARMKSRSAPMVKIAVFGAGATSCNLVEPGKDPAKRSEGSPKYDIDCLWPVRLEVFLNNILNHYQHLDQKRAIVNVVPMNSYGLPVTAEFATAIIQNKLWNKQLSANDGPDVILTAFNAHDMFLPKRGWKTAEDINYYHHQREIVQGYIRSSLELKKCNNKDRDPPLVISVDNYVGNQHGPVMAENVQARVLQLLSDYYETAFVSYAEVIRRLVYASDKNRSPLLHTTLKEWTGDWQSISETSQQEDDQQKTIEHGFLGPIAMTLTLAYSFLRYTVSHCEDKVNHRDQDYSIIPEAVFKLTEEVPPPELNTDLTLSNVSELWRKEQATQSNLDMYCTSNPMLRRDPCEFAFWGGTFRKSDDFVSYLEKHAKMEGWETGQKRLTATKKGASMRFTFNILPEQQKWKITIFSVFRDSEAAPNTKLQWQLSNDATRRRLQHQQQQQQHSNHTTVQSRRRLQGASSGIIEGTHDSPSTMVLPTYIPVDQALLNDEMHFDLKLIEGDNFEILAIMFCSEDI